MSVLRVEDAEPGVRTLVLDRPDALNALDRELKAVLLAALRAGAPARAGRAGVLSRAGRAVYLSRIGEAPDDVRK